MFNIYQRPDEKTKEHSCIQLRFDIRWLQGLNINRRFISIKKKKEKKTFCGEVNKNLPQGIWSLERTRLHSERKKLQKWNEVLIFSFLF
jgi:hypothetical protein